MNLKWLFALLIFLLPNICFGLSFDGISASPANPDTSNELTKQWFIYNLDAGQDKQDALQVKNESQNTVLLDIYSVDSSINEVGGLSLKEREQEQNDIGSWITFEENSFSLEPQEEKTIGFTITIPDDASVGEHYGGIVIETSNENKKQLQESGLQVPTKMALRVYQTVPGSTIKQLKIADFSNSGRWSKQENKAFQIFDTEIKNTGNTSVDAHLTVSYTNYLLGIGNNNHKEEVTIARGENYTHSLETDVARFGFFKAEATLSYEDQNGDTQVIYSPVKTFITMPWIEIIVLLIIILAGIFLYILQTLWIQFKKRRLNIYDVQEGDDILYVAEKTNTPWKRIVKYNKLEKPYVLTPGTALYVHCLPDEAEEIEVESPQEEEDMQEHDVDTVIEETEEMHDVTHMQEKNSKVSTALILKILIIFLTCIIIISVGLLVYFSFQHKRVNFSIQKSKVPSSSVELPEVAFDDIESSEIEEETLIEDIDTQQEDVMQELTILPSEITLHIYNGTNISGKAGQLQNQLEDLEYTIPVIGNANQKNTGFSIILHTADQLDQAKTIQSSLEEIGIESVLSEDDTITELSIIIGSQGL